MDILIIEMMTKNELIALVTEIMKPQGKSEEELDNLLGLLHKNVPHPSPSDLIYWENLTPEQVVDKALAYKPIQL
jgi:hypothetical protein